jgi:hypothetical protein
MRSLLARDYAARISDDQRVVWNSLVTRARGAIVAWPPTFTGPKIFACAPIPDAASDLRPVYLLHTIDFCLLPDRAAFGQSTVEDFDASKIANPEPCADIRRQRDFNAVPPAHDQRRQSVDAAADGKQWPQEYVLLFGVQNPAEPIHEHRLQCLIATDCVELAPR